MRLCACLSLLVPAVCVLVTAAANANPTGAQVVSGSATLQQTGNVLQITNTPSAIINWQSFSIGASETTRFVQQSASSAVLNRVVAQNPSSILGALQSNGRVFLINPNGILFGAGARVDVAGLVASTLNLADADFLAGRLRFAETPGAGALVNQGAMSGGGGSVYLVGPSVTNGGVISSPQGEVVLAAGRSVELVNPGTPGLLVQINAPDNEAVNLGQIMASSGRIGIFAGLIRNSGVLNADRVVAGPAGEITLKAATIITESPASISAAGGTIRLDATHLSVGQNTSITTAPGTITITASVLDLHGQFSADLLTVAPQAGGSAIGGGAILSPVPTGPASGTVTIGAGSPANANLGTLLASSIGGGGGGGTAPTIVTGSGRITVNGQVVSLVPDRAALNTALREFELSIGQVVGPLLWNSTGYGPTWIMDRWTPRLVPPRRSDLVTE